MDLEPKKWCPLSPEPKPWAQMTTYDKVDYWFRPVMQIIGMI